MYKPVRSECFSCRMLRPNDRYVSHTEKNLRNLYKIGDETCKQALKTIYPDFETDRSHLSYKVGLQKLLPILNHFIGTLMGGTFHLSMSTVMCRMGCMPILIISVTFVTVTVTESRGVCRPLDPTFHQVSRQVDMDLLVSTVH